MEQYEFMVSPIHYDRASASEDISRPLDYLGKDGWMLVSTVPAAASDEDRSAICILQRRKRG